MSERLTQLEKLFVLDPNDPFLTYGIAMEHSKADRFEAAIEWLDRTLALDAGYCYAYFQKGRMLSELGEVDQAREATRAGLAVAKQTGDDKAFSELSELLASMDD